jgi:steroid delta-isomerase-like uncharacterized protein
MGLARQVAEQKYALQDGKEFDALAALYAPGATITGPGAPDMTPDGYIAYVKALSDAMPDLRHEMTTMLETDSAAAYELIARGIFTEALQTPAGSVPPNGQVVAVELAQFLTVDDKGKIVRDRTYFDQVSFLAQVGVMPAS